MNRALLSVPMMGVMGGMGVLLFAAAGANGQAVGTSFVYQGELRHGEGPADGAFDARFRLYDGLLSPVQVGPTLCVENVAVVAGRFSAELDFGSVFSGAARFLEIEVRPDAGAACSSGAGYMVLTPRQRVSATPYSMNAANTLALNGQGPSYYTNAANMTGTLPDARLSSNVGLLGGAQTFSGSKTFTSAPVFNAAGAPFTVASAAKVVSLNSDLLDGFDSSAFAPNSHGHDASAITSGTLADSRLSSAIPRVNQSNVFTDTQVIQVASQTPLTLYGTALSGTWVNLLNTGGGRTWNLIATGSGNSEGAGKLLVRDQTGLGVRVALDSTGRVGLGTTSPTSLLELSQADAAVRIRNTNDPGGGFVQNSFATLQLGMYTPSASAWGAVPASGTRAMLGMQNTGRVGTLTNTGLAPIWRNVLDDGAGNASIQGSISAANMPAVKWVANTESGYFRNDSRTLIETVTVNVPAAGYLRISARARIFVTSYDSWSSTATLELKETTGAEVAVKDAPAGISGGQPNVSGVSWNGEVSLDHMTATGAGTRTFKLRLLHNTFGSSFNGVTYTGSELTVMFIPAGL